MMVYYHQRAALDAVPDWRAIATIRHGYAQAIDFKGHRFYRCHVGMKGDHQRNTAGEDRRCALMAGNDNAGSAKPPWPSGWCAPPWTAAAFHDRIDNCRRVLALRNGRVCALLGHRRKTSLGTSKPARPSPQPPLTEPGTTLLRNRKTAALRRLDPRIAALVIGGAGDATLTDFQKP
jgi:hypothetical protein